MSINTIPNGDQSSKYLNTATDIAEYSLTLTFDKLYLFVLPFLKFVPLVIECRMSLCHIPGYLHVLYIFIIAQREHVQMIGSVGADVDGSVLFLV